MQLFDGWIAGILLSTRLGDLQLLPISDPPASWGVPAMRMSQQTLFEYVVNEVFSREPEVYTFIKEAAILQQMTIPLCNALLDISNAGDHLTHLERQGLSVTRSADTSQASYTCHPALREVFCSELHAHKPARFTALHRRAAELFIAIPDYEQAIYHALQAGAYDMAAQAITTTSTHMLAQGHLETLERWLEALPPTIMRHYPRLLLVWATTYLRRYEPPRALALIENELASGERTILDDDPDAVLLQAKIALIRAHALFRQGAYAQAQEIFHRVLAQLLPDEARLRAEAHMGWEFCAAHLGNFSASLMYLQRALHLWCHCKDQRGEAKTHTALANVHSAVGNHALSEHHRRRALHCWDRLY